MKEMQTKADERVKAARAAAERARVRLEKRDSELRGRLVEAEQRELTALDRVSQL